MVLYFYWPIYLFFIEDIQPIDLIGKQLLNFVRLYKKSTLIPNHFFTLEN